MDGHGALDDHPVAGYTGPPTNGPDDEHGAEPRSPVSSELSVSHYPQYFSEHDGCFSVAQNTSIPMVLYPLPVNTLEVEVSVTSHSCCATLISALEV
jgi:hypothetical protein